MRATSRPPGAVRPHLRSPSGTLAVDATAAQLAADPVRGMTAGRSAGIVLAAGGSRRMGSPKQLLPVAGRPLLEHVVAAACASRLDQVVVILGANAAAIGGAVAWGRARTVLNPDHAQGMSTSLHAGVRVLDGTVERCVVILGDQPGLDAATLDRLLDAQADSGLPASALSFDGLLHPPVVLQRELWPELLALRGDVGLRHVIRARPERVAAVAAAAPLHHPVDVDTPEDFARLTEPPRP
jgi:molybdenum cofactor cytidylyltransferase